MRGEQKFRWSTAAGGGTRGQEVSSVCYRRTGSRGRRTKRAGASTARKLRALAYEVTIAEARERARIAAGLHDEIGQVLALIRLKLGELPVKQVPGSAADLIEEVRGLVGQAIRATRSATFDLSCPVLERFGLQAAIEIDARRMRDSFGICVEVEGGHPVLPIAKGDLEVLYRVVRELLFNIHKHARAWRARVVLQCLPEKLLIRVCDDGIGFEPGRLTRGGGPQGGFGLYNARVQMEAIGGRLQVEAEPGRGTCVVLILPLSDELVAG